MDLSLTHEGEPVPKGRPKTNLKTGTIFTPGKTRQAEEDLGWAMRVARPRNWDLESYFGIQLRFFLKTFRRIDQDNLTKLVMDAGNTILWKDDQQIVESHVYVVRGVQNPRTELRAWRVPCPHEMKK